MGHAAMPHMTSVFIPAMSLLVVVFLGLLGLRRFSVAVRLIFNVTFFLAISIFFWTLDIFPMFAPLSVSDDSRALWLRAFGGAWWILGARVTVTVAWFSLHRDERSREARLFSDLFAGAVYIATAAVILNSVFALPLTGVVATSGVVAIVLGLALQSTLADVFAGIAVGVEAPFGVGDRVQIGDATEGEVVQMNWRSIHVQTDGDDVAVIPNSVVSKAYILNRSFPSHRRTASVDIACPEGVSPERAIETLLHSTKLCPGILPDPPVTAMLVQLGPTNTFRVSFSIEEAKNLASTRDILLRAARRQMYYAGLFDKDHATLSPTRSTGNITVRRRLLRDIVLFESLSEKQIEQLGNSLEAVRLEPGDIVFSQGEVDAYL